MRHVRKTVRDFDKSKPLVSLRHMTVLGKSYARGDDLPDLNLGIAQRLWLSERADYKSDYTPTPVSKNLEPLGPEDKLVSTPIYSFEHVGGGHYLISGPGLGEGKRVKGKAAAKAEVERLESEIEDVEDVETESTDDEGDSVDAALGDSVEE